VVTAGFGKIREKLLDLNSYVAIIAIIMSAIMLCGGIYHLASQLHL
jgi:hypothetical protein